MQARSRGKYEIAGPEVVAAPRKPRFPSAATQLRVLGDSFGGGSWQFPTSAQVVCLATSNTAGKTVSAQDAYPA
jgi:hypothetical protein